MKKKKTDNIKANSMRAALCGILTALSVVLLMLVPVIPIMLYCAPVLSGLCVAVAADEYGKGYSFGVFAAASILSFLIAADKEAVLVFILLAGAYPIIRYIVEASDKNKVFKLAVKLGFINLSIIA